MGYIEEIEAYIPLLPQEENDKRLMLKFIKEHSDNVLCRENETAHITSSGFIFNTGMDKALMAFHNILDVWAWTGGHADGDADLLSVARREAQEETGIRELIPLSKSIASLDILTVPGHFKKRKYISAHLHLSVAYLFMCGEEEAVRVKPDENKAVAFMPLRSFTRELFDETDFRLYQKLIARGKMLKESSAD